MQNVLIISSIALWCVVIVNLLFTLSLVRMLKSNGADFDMGDLDTGLEVGTPAPDFSAQNVTGDTVTLADFAKKTVSFVFVSPHCPPCVDKLAQLNEFAPKALKKGVEIVLVNTTGGLEATQAFAEKYNIKLPLLAAPETANSFVADYRVNGTPTYTLVDSNRVIKEAGLFGLDWQSTAASWAA